jgi:hypothetical protein
MNRKRESGPLRCWNLESGLTNSKFQAPNSKKNQESRIKKQEKGIESREQREEKRQALG